MVRRYHSVAIAVFEPLGNAFFLSRDKRLRDVYEARIALLEDCIRDLRSTRDNLQERLDYYSGFSKDLRELPPDEQVVVRQKFTSPQALRRHLEQIHRIPKEKSDGTN